MAFQVKSIKPPRMNPNAYRLEIVKELNDQAQIMRRLYLKTVRTWKAPRPVFKVTAAIKGPPGPRGGVATQQAIASVETTDERFIWTDQGTRPHIIRSKRGRLLRFKVGGYQPKTRRRTLGSGRGKAGRSWRSAEVIHHPGTKAREFTREIQKRRRAPFFKAMREANLRGIRRAQRG